GRRPGIAGRRVGLAGRAAVGEAVRRARGAGITGGPGVARVAGAHRADVHERLALDRRVEGTLGGLHVARVAGVARVAALSNRVGPRGGAGAAGVAGVGGRGLRRRGTRVAGDRERVLGGVDVAAVATVGVHIGDGVAAGHLALVKAGAAADADTGAGVAAASGTGV